MQEDEETQEEKKCAQRYCPSPPTSSGIYCKQHAYLQDIPKEMRVPKQSVWVMPKEESKLKIAIFEEDVKPVACVTCGNANVKLNEFFECASCVQDHIDMESTSDD